MEDVLAQMCGKLNLSEEKEIGVTLSPTVIAETGREHDLCLVGGLVVGKVINKEVFWRTMMAVWGLTEFVGFHEVGEILFIIQFKKRADMKHIWDERPWAFDRNLLRSPASLKDPAAMSEI